MKTAFVNGNVITIHQDHPRAEAFLVEDGIFIQVGRVAEVLASSGDSQVV